MFGCLFAGLCVCVCTRQMYWLCGPGEKVLDRMMVFPRTKGFCCCSSCRLSLGRTTEEDEWRIPSILVSLFTCNRPACQSVTPQASEFQCCHWQCPR